jgi:hypothetical protein
MPSTDAIPSPIARLALEPPGTTADLIGLLSNLFFLPGDLLLWALTAHAAPLAHSLGVGPRDYGGVLSGFISSCAWIAAFISVAIVCQAVVDFDRRVTAATKRLFASATLRVRIARTVWRQRIRAWLAARAPENPVELASDIEVSPEQLQALRLHAKLPPGYALTAREAAEATGARLRATQDLLDGLHKLGLLQPTFGGEDDERAYVLTKAGKALLVFRKLDDARSPVRAPTVRREPPM